MRIYAFDGLHYAPRAGSGAQLAAPPYDQIDDAERDRLHAVSPRQFTHLTRPLAGPDGTPYAVAAALHRRWLEDGIVVRDEVPALYPYEIRLAAGGVRRGLCGLVGIEDATSRIIQAHERTIEKPLADRLALLRAMRVDLEPILLLANDQGGLEDLLPDFGDEPLLAAHTDAAGNVHRLARVSDTTWIARLEDLLAPVPGLIADGHHRYKVAQMYAEETAAAPGTAAAAKLAVVTSLASPALAIAPIHRGLAAAVDLAPAALLTRSRTLWEGATGADFAAAVAAATAPALGVQRAGEAPEIWHLEPDTGPEELPEAAHWLPVVLLHSTLLPACGLGEASASDGTIAYFDDPEELFSEVAAGRIATGFWLPPMDPEDFAAAIAKGDLLPPKSTRFLPKVVSGLVWADHACTLA